jgi:tRNA threonylcarbamoyladenosine biosynthesis protein TsaB
MVLLALDTALGATQVAVFDGTTALASERQEMATGHAEALLPMVERVLVAAGRGYGGLDRIAVTVGPGTFTGVRIALAAARALGLALGKPVVGVTTLAALAHERGAVVAVIDARRGEIYAQRFDDGGAPLSTAEAVTLDRLAARLPERGRLVGTGAPLLHALRPDLVVIDAPVAPDIAAVARLGAAQPVPIAPPAPLYLRAPDAKPQAPPLPRRP